MASGFLLEIMMNSRYEKLFDHNLNVNKRLSKTINYEQWSTATRVISRHLRNLNVRWLTILDSEVMGIIRKVIK